MRSDGKTCMLSFVGWHEATPEELAEVWMATAHSLYEFHVVLFPLRAVISGGADVLEKSKKPALRAYLSLMGAFRPFQRDPISGPYRVAARPKPDFGSAIAPMPA